jgi:hypothetical protein
MPQDDAFRHRYGPAVPGLSTVEAVVDRLFASLTNGPTVYATDDIAAT